MLQHVLDVLAVDLALDEADRPELDHDTKGIAGAPPIADTILAKIDASDVFVADVTLTGETGIKESKSLMNSNVAIELGYALKSKGDRALLMVMNTYYGAPEKLPFDLRHRRWPILFSLPADADKEVREAAKRDLVDKLKPILRDYVHLAKSSIEPLRETPATTSPAHYWQTGEVLVTADRGRGWSELRCDSESLLFLRIWPEARLPQLSERDTSSLLWANKVGPLRVDGPAGYSSARNRYGGIVYDSDRETTDQVLTATQLFCSREIWGFDETCLANVRDNYYGQKVRVIPSLTHEEILTNSCRRYLTFAQHILKYPSSFVIEAGASNIQEFYIGVGHHFTGRLLVPFTVSISLSR